MVAYRETRGRAWRRRWFPPRMHRPSRESSRATGTLGKTCPVPPTPRGSASPLHDSVDLVALAEPLLLEGRFLSGSRYGEGHQNPVPRPMRDCPPRKEPSNDFFLGQVCVCLGLFHLTRRELSGREFDYVDFAWLALGLASLCWAYLRIHKRAPRVIVVLGIVVSSFVGDVLLQQ